MPVRSDSFSPFGTLCVCLCAVGGAVAAVVGRWRGRANRPASPPTRATRAPPVTTVLSLVACGRRKTDDDDKRDQGADFGITTSPA